MRCARSAGALIIVTVAVTSFRPAFGQEAPGAASPATVEEIVVTGTKRAVPLQDAALSITALGSDALQFQDMDDLEDMQSSVPGLSVGTILGTPIINIRGVGLNFVTGFGTPGVAAHYDGIYLPRTGSTNVATVDLERVEVLRGPQGTLYGRNATGGAINFVPKRPGDELGAGVTLGYGSYEQRSAEAWVEGPVVTDLAARAYFKKEAFDGYGINEANGRDVGDNDATMGRFALDYRPLPDLSVVAAYTYRNDEGAQPFSTPLSTVTSLTGVEYPREEQTFEPFNNKTLRHPHAEKTTHIASLIADWAVPWLDDGALKSTTGFVRHTREEASALPEINRSVGDAFRDETAKGGSEELTLSGKFLGGRIQWLVGAYYAITEAESRYAAVVPVDLFPVPAGSLASVIIDNRPEEKEHAWAGFMDGSWSIWTPLRLNFGLRYSTETKEQIQTRTTYGRDELLQLTVVPEEILALAGSVSCSNAKFEKTDTSFDPKVGLEWDVLPDAMAYVQFQTGFKAGGFNVVNSCGETIDPERIKATELGLKSRWFDGALTANAALFHYGYKDYQVERIDGFAIEQVNAAEATTIGAELETTALVNRWLSFNLAATYLDAEFDEFSLADPFKNTIPLTGDAPVEDLSGRRLTRSPKFTFSGGINLDGNPEVLAGFVAWANWLTTLRLRFEGFYSDHVFFREFNTPEDRQDAWGTIGVFAEARWWKDKIGLHFIGKNLTDTRYLAGQVPLGTLFYRGGYYAPPRTFGVELDWMW